jgi:hypothetical protein
MLVEGKMRLSNLFLNSKIRICNGPDYLLLLKAELLNDIPLLALLLLFPSLMILLALLIGVNLLVLLMLLDLLILMILL